MHLFIYITLLIETLLCIKIKFVVCIFNSNERKKICYDLGIEWHEPFISQAKCVPRHEPFIPQAKCVPRHESAAHWHCIYIQDITYRVTVSYML